MQAPPPAFGFTAASDRLGLWNLYFIAKLVLLGFGLIGMHLVPNLVFLAALFALGDPRWRRFRPWIGVPVAIALLYYDSWLPGFSRVVSQASLVSSFTGAYLAELAGRFVNWAVIAAIVVAAALYFAIVRFAKLRMDVFVAFAVVVLALVLAPPSVTIETAPATAAAPGAPAAPATAAAARDPDAIVRDFFAAEGKRSVSFAAPPADAPPFDVIFLHVCSLSWDDLDATGLTGHPLFAGFDLVLKRFNSVSTYSGPAAIRFLRAPCGQPTHRALYEPTQPQCQLMPALQAAGLESQVVLNHDGHFDDFLKHVKAQGVQATPLSLSGAPAPYRSFDDSRIYDDGAMLKRWLDARAKAPAPRAAVYYNTVSLHDGNRLVSDPGKTSADTYKARLTKLLDELDGFMKQLASSGRRAIVLMVPEHGVALRGDAAQIPGLREIPTPAITLVPVGVKVVGPDAKREGEAVQVSEPTSYLAVSHIVARALAKPPFGASGFRAADLISGLPTTEFVSEGENAVVVARGAGYALKLEKDPWKELRK